MASSSEEGPVTESDESQQTQSVEGMTRTDNPLKDRGGHVSLDTLDKSVQGSNAGTRISQLDKEGSISSIVTAKVPGATAAAGSTVVRSGHDGRSPVIREKVSEDGYNWRKYGQKLVKGNEFVRSYYRCTHPSCSAKKQLECSNEGRITDIMYLGQHDHPKPHLNAPLAVGFLLSAVENEPQRPSVVASQENPTHRVTESRTTSQISTITSSKDPKSVPPKPNNIRDDTDNEDTRPSKRQKLIRKKTESNSDPTSLDKPTDEARLVIQTLSEVDIVNDGYRWRKYGQKMVKGSPYPRSYYRCSSPGCPVKKHVERASHDPKVVITSYEGQHDHNKPLSRTITHNADGVKKQIVGVPNGDSDPKPNESVAASDGKAFCVSLDPNGKTKEKLNNKTVSEPEISYVSNSGFQCKSNEQHNGKHETKEESNASGVDVVVKNSQQNTELRTDSTDSVAAREVSSITSGLEKE